MKKATIQMLTACLLCGMIFSTMSCAGIDESVSKDSSSSFESSISENKTQSYLQSEDTGDSSSVEETVSFEESSSEGSSSENSSIEESSSEESSSENSSIEESSSEESSSENSSIEESSSEESSSEDSSEEKEPIRHYPYQIGDTVEDFSLMLSDGSMFTLSEALQDNKLVIVKFWATWCKPCVMEWGAMTEAFYDYQDDVLILCISLTESDQEIEAYKKDNNLPFAMASDSLKLSDEFGVAAIPHKFVIDRNGILVESKVGSVTDAAEYVKLFERYCAD